MGGRVCGWAGSRLLEPARCIGQVRWCQAASSWCRPGSAGWAVFGSECNELTPEPAKLLSNYTFVTRESVGHASHETEVHSRTLKRRVSGANHNMV